MDVSWIQMRLEKPIDTWGNHSPLGKDLVTNLKIFSALEQLLTAYEEGLREINQLSTIPECRDLFSKNMMP